MVDVDPMAEDADGRPCGFGRAQAALVDLLRAWNLPPLAPQVRSRSGGWHYAFSVPADVDMTEWRQPKLVTLPGFKKAIIETRVHGFTVIPPSKFAGQDYTFYSDPIPAPYPAPDALIEVCRTKSNPPTTTPAVVKTGEYDPIQFAKIVLKMDAQGAFDERNDWRDLGMVCKVEWGDDPGREIWDSITIPGSSDDDAQWRSFRSEYRPNDITIRTILKRAADMGIKDNLPRNLDAMFGGITSRPFDIKKVAQEAFTAPPQTPPAQPGVPMLGRGEKQTEYGEPILREFLKATSGPNVATRPQSNDVPQLPDAAKAHGLFDLLNESITRIFVMSEAKGFKGTSIVDPLGVLKIIHIEAFDAVTRRLRALGVPLHDAKISNAANSFLDAVERALISFDDWKRNGRDNKIDPDNPDNIIILLARLSLELRWNAWLERMEIKGGPDADLRWPNWTYVDDNVVARLRTRAKRTEIDFHPGKDFTWESLLALSQEPKHIVDPVLDLLRDLEQAWDGVPRLASWLSTFCHVPNDLYHQSVGRSIIGGMVTRARNPGCKFDTMPIFFGPQGTGKSTLISILALRPEYFSDAIMLGDASKELILSLAGKLCVEISEMGMRGNTNANHVKAMVSRTTDAGRTAYARAVTERARRNIFCGSTNDDSPLSDPSGNRRFLPIRIDQPIDLAGLRGAIAQIVGEAAHLESNGIDMSIPPEVYEVAAQHQEAARSISDMEARLLEWFSETTYTKEAYVLTSDLAELSEMLNWRNAQTLRNLVLKNLGFKEARPYLGPENRPRVWVRGTSTDFANMTRYRVSKSPADGRPRVTLDRNVPVPSSAGLPPLPPRVG
jgi:predicted P-loop ATPase